MRTDLIRESDTETVRDSLYSDVTLCVMATNAVGATNHFLERNTISAEDQPK
ncbi:MAG: hypothetical protein K9I85_00285 [Saprospiraceae bacterium]|nr:hypothetical protein [Saprospiraceae bacterium]